MIYLGSDAHDQESIQKNFYAITGLLKKNGINTAVTWKKGKKPCYSVFCRYKNKEQVKNVAESGGNGIYHA
jgi:hypothetical protein